MRGLFKRKSSDIWQGRFRIPEELWRQRGRLLALGVRDLGRSQEFAKSTGHADRDEAAVSYRRMLTLWDERLASWTTLLRDGPQALSPKQQMALAADHAKAFLSAHEDDPFSTPSPRNLPESIPGNDAAWSEMTRSMQSSQRAAFAKDLQVLLRTKDGERRSSLAFRLLEKYPGMRAVLAPALAATLEAIHGADTDAALASKGLDVDSETRRLVNLEMARLMGAAERGLEAMRGGIYDDVRELKAAPAFVATPKTRGSSEKVDTKFTFTGIVDAEKARRALGKDAKPFPEATVRKYSKHGEEFADWRRSQGLSKPASTDARTVTRDEAERWRTAMQTKGDLSNRTINGKVAGISTIIRWGRRLLRDDFHPNGNPLEGLEKLDFVMLDSDARTYRIDEAVTVLKAASKETEHRRRWLPWICAYTGMRIEEAGQLTAEDFFQVDGRWFFRVSTSGRRSLKTASSQRRIPVHPSLELEGFMKFVQRVGKGPLFESQRIQPLMSEWVRDKVGIKRTELSPNHGWRHFFEDLCALAGMPDSAREYITGRASGKSRDLYGKSELMLPGLAAAMDKVPDILHLKKIGGDRDGIPNSPRSA
ncbi:hypothetical protein [Shinella zoogloeoides]|uniref:hypothetical protein n=1 Tax=Shinella zoogloeoides TaxID=352475 RepID=UPI001F55C271|nr:hypothetical protein [Shinella zoogloeoides]